MLVVIKLSYTSHVADLSGDELQAFVNVLDKLHRAKTQYGETPQYTADIANPMADVTIEIIGKYNWKPPEQVRAEAIAAENEVDLK